MLGCFEIDLAHVQTIQQRFYDAFEVVEVDVRSVGRLPPLPLAGAGHGDDQVAHFIRQLLALPDQEDLADFKEPDAVPVARVVGYHLQDAGHQAVAHAGPFGAGGVGQGHVWFVRGGGTRRVEGCLALRCGQPVGDDLLQSRLRQQVARLFLAQEWQVVALRWNQVVELGVRDAIIAVNTRYLFDQVGPPHNAGADVHAIVGDSYVQGGSISAFTSELQ